VFASIPNDPKWNDSDEDNKKPAAQVNATEDDLDSETEDYSLAIVTTLRTPRQLQTSMVTP
jgi:hypothetical protein